MAAAGLPRADARVVAFVASLKIQPERDQFGGLDIEHFPSKGVSVYTGESGTVSSVFLFAGGADGIQRYQGKLPSDLTFESGRGDVLAKFGQPDRIGPDWDRFQMGTTYLHFRYASDRAGISVFTAFPWCRD
jgi:hypothetical protein